MKEIKVGQRVTIILEVIEQKSCNGCFFNGADDYCGATSLGLKLDCVSQCRSDGKNVIFKEVKQNMLREDIRGICHRPCIYNDKGKYDM